MIDKYPWLLPSVLIAAGIKCILLYSGILFSFFGAIGALLGLHWLIATSLALALTVFIFTVVGFASWRWSRGQCPIPERWIGRTPEKKQAGLVKSSPAPNTAVQEASELTLWFGAPIDPSFSNVSLVDASGKPVETGEAAIDEENREVMRLALPQLDEGIYTVNWRTLHALTGITQGGSFKFRIAESASVPAERPGRTGLSTSH